MVPFHPHPFLFFHSRPRLGLSLQDGNARELGYEDSKLSTSLSSLPVDSGPFSHLRHGLLSTSTSSFPSASSTLPVLLGLHAQHQDEPTAHHFLVSQPLWHQEEDASSVLLMDLK